MTSPSRKLRLGALLLSAALGGSAARACPSYDPLCNTRLDIPTFHLPPIMDPPPPAPSPAQPTAARALRIRMAGAPRVFGLSLRAWTSESGRAAFPNARVHGFMLDPDRGDVVLLLSAPQNGGSGADLRLADFQAALRAARSGGEPPYCSLDPDPADPGGPQKVRVGGVPFGSGFALAMLDADYLMKKAGLGQSELDGVSSLPDLAQDYFRQDCSRMQDAANRPMFSRFWFTPQAMRYGDILASASGRSFLIRSRVEVRTERMMQGGSAYEGTGEASPVPQSFADGLTRSFKALQDRVAEFGELQDLYQWVYVAKLLQRKAGSGETALLDRWSGSMLSDDAGTPSTYPGLSREVQVQACGQSFPLRMMGGVKIDPELDGEQSSASLDGFEEEVLRSRPDDGRDFWEIDADLPAEAFQ